MNQGGNRDMKTFTPSDVVIHNQPCDLWVSYLGNVYNLTPLIVEFTNIGAVKLIKPLLAFGGKDISEWFNPDTGERQLLPDFGMVTLVYYFLNACREMTSERLLLASSLEEVKQKDSLNKLRAFLLMLRTYTHPITWTTAPYTPHGTLPHLGPLMPTSLWKPLTKKPWWKDTRYMIGRLTAKARPIRILNVLTGHDDQIEVCCEDTLNRIQERYLFLNNHSGSYTWKFEGRVLNMNLTLAENDIPDEREEFNELLLPEKFYIPAIMIYNNDDLTSS